MARKGTSRPSCRAEPASPGLPPVFGRGKSAGGTARRIDGAAEKCTDAKQEGRRGCEGVEVWMNQERERERQRNVGKREAQIPESFGVGVTGGERTSGGVANGRAGGAAVVTVPVRLKATAAVKHSRRRARGSSEALVRGAESGWVGGWMGSEATVRTAMAWSWGYGATCCCRRSKEVHGWACETTRNLVAGAHGYLAAEPLVESPEAGVLKDRHRCLPEIFMDPALQRVETKRGERGSEARHEVHATAVLRSGLPLHDHQRPPPNRGV